MFKEKKLQIFLMKKEFIHFDNPKILIKKRSPSAKTSSDTNKAYFNSIVFNETYLKLVQNRLFYSITQRSLCLKYNTTPDKYGIMMFNNVIQSKYCRTLAVFKEILLYNYIEEFLKRYYKIKESCSRLKKCFAYYKNYLLYFCNPIFSKMAINELMQAKGEKKAKVYYSLNIKNNHFKVKDKETKLQYQIIKPKKKNDKEDLVIFSSTIKEIISKPSIISNSKTNIYNKHIDDESVIYFNNDLIENNSNDNTMNDIVKQIKDKADHNLNIPQHHIKPKLIISKRKSKDFQAINDNQSRNVNRMQLIPYRKTKEKQMEKYSNAICHTESNKKDYLNNNTSQEGTIGHAYLKTEIPTRYSNKRIGLNKEKIRSKVKLKVNPIHQKNVYSIQVENRKGVSQTKKKLSLRMKDCNSNFNNNHNHVKIALRAILNIDGNKQRLKSVYGLFKTGSRNKKDIVNNCFNTQTNGIHLPHLKQKGESFRMTGFQGKALKQKKPKC